MKINSSKTKMSPDELRSIYMWFFIMRGVGTVIVAAGVIVMDFMGLLAFDPRPVLFFVLPFLLLINFFWRFCPWCQSRLSFSLHVQIFVDLLAITAGIYFSGGLTSDFMYLYFIVVLSAALISLRMTIYTILTTLVLYFLAMQIEFFYPVPFSYEEGLPGDTHYITHIAVFVLMLTNIGFQAYYYISRLRKKDEEILRTKDEFLFRTVHDLRSPSTAISWFLEKCERAEYTKFFPKIKEDVKEIKELNSRVSHLIGELAAVVRGERQEIIFKKEKVDMGAAIRAVLKEIEPEIDAKKIKVEYVQMENLPSVVADNQELKEALANLLNNAVKYNTIEGKVFIGHAIEKGFLKTIIRNTGPGIKEESLGKIFTPFFRDHAVAGIVGTGLGLYLTKKLIEKMAGKIEVISEPGQWTTFTISLPLASELIEV